MGVSSASTAAAFAFGAAFPFALGSTGIHDFMGADQAQGTMEGEPEGRAREFKGPARIPRTKREPWQASGRGEPKRSMAKRRSIGVTGHIWVGDPRPGLPTAPDD